MFTPWCGYLPCVFAPWSAYVQSVMSYMQLHGVYIFPCGKWAFDLVCTNIQTFMDETAIMIYILTCATVLSLSHLLFGLITVG